MNASERETEKERERVGMNESFFIIEQSYRVQNTNKSNVYSSQLLCWKSLRQYEYLVHARA